MEELFGLKTRPF